MSKDILSLDPGRDKVGAAVLSQNAEEKEKSIIKREEIVKHLTEVFDKYDINIIVFGGGTGAEELIEEIKENIDIGDKKIKMIDEEYTTEEAQARYLAEKPMSRYEKLLRMFINWKVNKPLDDYAALIIAEKYLKKHDCRSTTEVN
jgi:RNase H-fold protein (predicted Holliday junction resolvase)